MDDCQTSSSLLQAWRLKKLNPEGSYTYDAIFDIMGEVKKDELDKVTIKNEVLRKYFSRSHDPPAGDFIIELLER